MAENVAGPEANEPKQACSLCGRTFAVSSLPRHEVICKKQANKKRKVFDSGKQRATGSDVPINAVKKVQQEIKKNNGTFQRPKTHWREKHEMFMSAVKAAKGVDYALKTGAPLPPPPKSVVPSDYVKCEYCGRNFSQAAADRHIPFCKESKSRGPSKPAPAKPAVSKPALSKAPVKKTNSQPTTTTNTISAPKSAAPKSAAPKSAAGSKPVKSAGPDRTTTSAGTQGPRSASQSRIPNGIPKPSMMPVPKSSLRKPSPSRTAGKIPSAKR